MYILLMIYINSGIIKLNNFENKIINKKGSFSWEMFVVIYKMHSTLPQRIWFGYIDRKDHELLLLLLLCHICDLISAAANFFLRRQKKCDHVQRPIRNRSYRHIPSRRLAAISLWKLVISIFLRRNNRLHYIFFLRRYRHHIFVTLAVLVAWYFSFIIVLVLPIDISTVKFTKLE